MKKLPYAATSLCRFSNLRVFYVFAGAPLRAFLRLCKGDLRLCKGTACLTTTDFHVFARASVGTLGPPLCKEWIFLAGTAQWLFDHEQRLPLFATSRRRHSLLWWRYPLPPDDRNNPTCNRPRRIAVALQDYLTILHKNEALGRRNKCVAAAPASSCHPSGATTHSRCSSGPSVHLMQ